MARLRSPTWRAQIDGLELHAVQGWLTSRSWAELVDLLIMAHVLGRIADYMSQALLR